MNPRIKPEIATWDEYALLDSGGYEKLERFGDGILSRPEPLAIWPKRDPELWKKAQIRYVPKGKDGMEGEWIRENAPASWEISRGAQKFLLRLTAFKHVGVFPEQAVNWDWIAKNVRPGMKVLNLFGYTGAASVAAAAAGADEVVHLDASKPSVEWAKENASRSGLGDAKIRFIIDDAGKFVAREQRRERKYDAIFLDPPAFGRGPKGELWRFERDLPPLLEEVMKLLPEKGGHLLLNTYSLGFPGTAVAQLVRSVVPASAEIQIVEAQLKEDSERGYMIPTGIATRATW